MLDTELNTLYESRTRQVLQEIGRYKLPEFVELVKDSRFLTVSPFYNDRSCWDTIQKSRFIESFLLNIPVPPITLWEIEFKSYELLDGRRRIDALREFYGDGFQLEGLEALPELNGCTYHEMPQRVRINLDRHNINTIALIADLASLEDALKIKRLTFDRLHPNN
jgi:hypothetical protein